MSITTTQLFDGVHLIHGIVGGRPLTLTLLIGSEKSLLMDTGCSSDVESIILPALGGGGAERLHVNLAKDWLQRAMCHNS